MAVTAPMDDPPGHSSWSQALDQLAYNGGNGRLILVSIGDVDPGDHMMLAQGYPSLNLNQRIDDPAQATNVLTIGACTMKTTLPPDTEFEDDLRRAFGRHFSLHAGRPSRRTGGRAEA